tara:strand:+ start:965 stop:1138 length:174 start_codon:yes stop_codon:yes gene_type:complete
MIIPSNRKEARALRKALQVYLQTLPWEEGYQENEETKTIRYAIYRLNMVIKTRTPGE